MQESDINGESEAAIAAFDQSPALALACEGDDLRVAALNAAAREAFGHLMPIGTALADVLPMGAAGHIVERMREVWTGGRPFSATGWRFELPGPFGDPVEYYADFSLTPWRYADGSPRGVIAQGRDVTEEVRKGRTEPDVTGAVQRALLPHDLPLLPGVRMAARYAAADEKSTGGDWFDAVPLSGGRLAVVVGDVAGHGVMAAAVMGRLRAVLHDHLSGNSDPDAVLQALDRYAASEPGAQAASICIAVLDPASGAVSYCTAGHGPPMIVSAHGVSRYLAPTGAGPLSTGADYVCGSDVIALDDVLLLYSDGLIGRPGRTPAEAIGELLVASTEALLAIGGAADAADRVCGQTLERLTGTGFTDDVVLLAAQRVQPPKPLHLRLKAEPATLRAVRRQFGAWLARIAASAQDVFALQHAVGEVVTNAIEHSPVPGREGHVGFSAELDSGGAVHTVVSDDGRWREPTSGVSYRGRGLAMATKLVDRVRVEPGPNGTTVQLHHRLRNPVRMDSGVAARAVPLSDAPFGLDVSYPDGPLLSVSGNVDTLGADKLGDVLLRESRGGTISATVDLTRATRLSSAAIRMLHLALERSARRGRPLRLVAEPGTVARQAMDHASLPVPKYALPMGIAPWETPRQSAPAEAVTPVELPESAGENDQRNMS
jgi:anti-sigma regulatory factor (Ser/Thr protein kinase)/anti-anti-sigma regulatory factor